MGGTPIVDAKILIPPPFRYAVDRPVARTMLDRGRRVGLTVVSAGPGYLKRQLVESWARADDSRRVAWSTLDGDDDSVRMLAHLVAALRRAVPDLAPDLDVAELAGGTPGWEGRVTDSLIEQLDALAEPVTLVLDGVHRLHDPVARRCLETMVRYRPGPLRVVLVTRDDGAVDLAGADLAGSVVQVREALLALDVEQTFRAVAAVGVDATMDDAAALHDATGGWPAGVLFAATAALDHGGPPVFQAGEEPVLSYLRNRMAELDADLREFFHQIAPLRQVSAELCTRVTGRADAGKLLDRLVEMHLLSTQAGLRPGWLRVPRHLAVFARHELRAADDDAAAELSRRAARWCWEHELLEDSMRIARDAGDTVLMAEILLDRHQSWSAGGLAGGVRRWCAVLLRQAPDLVEAHLASAWASLFLGEDDVAVSTIAFLEGLDIAGDRGVFVHGELAMVRAHLARRKGDLARSLAEVERAEEAARLLPADFTTPYKGALRGALSLHVGVAAVWCGAFERAVQQLDAARADPGWSPQALPAIHGHLAVAHWLLGDDAALAHAQVALTHVRYDQIGPADFSALCMGLVLGVDVGTDLLPYALALADELDEPAARVLSIAAEVHAVGDRDRSRALQAVRRAREVVEACPDPGALHAVLARSSEFLVTDHDPVLGDALTDGEERVLRMLGGSLTEREIAAELHLSHNTVRTYRRRLYRKLGVTSRSAAAQAMRDRPPG